MFQPLQEAAVATPWLDPVDVFIPYGGKRWLVKESISSKVRKEVRQLRQRAPRKPLVTWLGRSQWVELSVGNKTPANWSEDGQTTKMSGNPLKYTGIILNFDLWFGMVRVSNLSWRTWSILSNWTSERSLWNPFLSLYSDVFIYTCIYIFICIDCSGDSLYANINLPDSQIRMCFPGFKLGPNFSVDLLFWLNGMRLCESPTPQTFTPLLQLKSEDLNFHKKTG